MATNKKASTQKDRNGGTIALNRRARHDYAIEQKFEAGMVLQGWELKSIRAGKVQLIDSYVFLQGGEAYLSGANIVPLTSASTHVVAEPQRTRKLLLHAKELAQIFAATSQKGATCIATAMYWKGNKVKCEVALAKGKKEHDKRDTEKDRDWQRQKSRIMKAHNG